MKSRSVYYICKSGKSKAIAQQYRANFISLKSRLWEIIDRLGCKRAIINDEMMLISYVEFPQSMTPPEGWTKPDKDRLSRPKKSKENTEILKSFTPSGSYCVKTHPLLSDLWKWLGCPTCYQYTNGPNSSGSSRIGNIFHPLQVLWYDTDSPVCLVVPDVAAEKAEAIACGQVITDNVLDWTPPKGLVRTLPEEWALMAARHAAKAAAKAVE